MNKKNHFAKFESLAQIRFYFDAKVTTLLKKPKKHMAKFHYFSVQDKLGQTPLTDLCYFTVKQELEARLGSPLFESALKSKSVKALSKICRRV
jgi:dynein heavy chain 1